MKSLYELCLNTVVSKDIDYSELPDTIKEVVNKCKQHPTTRIVFPHRVDGSSIIALAEAVGVPLSENDMWCLKSNDNLSIERWLRDMKDPGELVSANWLNLLKAFLNKNAIVKNKKLRAEHFEKILHMLYTNSAVLNMYAVLYINLISTIQSRFLFILSSQESYAIFSPELRKMYQELWGVSPEVQHKKTEWAAIHRDIQLRADIEILNDEFPNFDLDLICAHSPMPYDIRNNRFWRRSLLRFIHGQEEPHWTKRSTSTGTLWLYMKKPIYEEGSIEVPFQADYIKDWTTGKVSMMQLDDLKLCMNEKTCFLNQ